MIPGLDGGLSNSTSATSGVTGGYTGGGSYGKTDVATSLFSNSGIKFGSKGIDPTTLAIVGVVGFIAWKILK